MRQRSLRELERKGGRSTGGKPLRRGRGWGGAAADGEPVGGKRRVAAILFDVGREDPDVDTH